MDYTEYTQKRKDLLGISIKDFRQGQIAVASLEKQCALDSFCNYAIDAAGYTSLKKEERARVEQALKIFILEGPGIFSLEDKATAQKEVINRVNFALNILKTEAPKILV